MSQENVERLRAFLLEWSREPWTLEKGPREQFPDMSLFDDDVVYEDTVLPDHVGEAYRGHEGVFRAAERWFEPFQWGEIELERILGSGNQFVSVHRWRAKARHTGLEFEAPLAYAWTFQGGKVTRFKSFADPAQALEAAGLSE